MAGMKSYKKRCFYAYVLVISLFIGLATLTDRTVTALAETIPVYRSNTIVIDPGHGGEDGGASSCTGVLESKINLDISLRLQNLLHFLGYETKMIRQTDTSVYTQGSTIAEKKTSDLKERVRMVNETANALLVSIHQNQFPEGKYRGAQVFYAATEGSDILADQLQEQLVQHLNPGSRRTSKRAEGVYLMKHIRCTGVLVECGFLSNPEEEALLRTPEYQKQICCVLAATLASYLENNNPEVYGEAPPCISP